MHQVLGLLFDGCQLSGVTSPFDVFNVINTLWQQQNSDDKTLYQCHIVTVDGAPIRASNGMTVHADFALTDAPTADIILIPGIHHHNTRNLTDKLNQLQKEKHWLLQRGQENTVIAANCSGTFLLAETGLLDNQSATTAWWLTELFSRRYPHIDCQTRTLITQSDRLYCTGAMSANLGTMLRIAEQQVGKQLVQDCAKTMLIDLHQEPLSPYLFLHENTQHQDHLVLEIESWMQRHLSQPLDLSDLAKRHAVSVRTLNRRFQQANNVSPSEYLQTLRLKQAQLLLKTTQLTMDQISERVGYSNQSSLRRLFQNALGVSPKAYRDGLG